MKAAINILIIGLGFISLPFALFGSWLLYQHVQATQLMWFLWWVTTPLAILISVLGMAAKHVLDKEK